MYAPNEDALRARRSARAVIGIQYTVVVLYLFGVGVPLLGAAIGTGDYAGIADPGLERYGDPKDWLPDSAWNPLLWLTAVGYAGVLFGLPILFGFFSAAAGVIQLGARRRELTRALRIWLLVGTVLTVVIGVLSLTPYGVQLRHWLAD